MRTSRNLILRSVLRTSVLRIGFVFASVVAVSTTCEASQQRRAISSPHEQARSEEESDVTTESPDKISPLINAAELKSLLATKPKYVKVLEPGKDQDVFTTGHLPSAQFVHWINDMIDPGKILLYNNLTPKQFEDLMGQLGIGNDDHVIIYDRMNSRLSTRLFWTFKLYGHPRVQILNGGFDVWNSRNNPISREIVPVTASNYKAPNTDKEILAKLDFVKAQLDMPGTRLIDGRPPKQYSGEESGKIFHTDEAHPRKGHIPGAINIFWKDNFNKDGTFKSPQRLRDLYRNAGVKPANEVITYCNEGLHAAPPWFVLHELLGYERVRLYDSSMAEWAKSDAPMNKTK